MMALYAEDLVIGHRHASAPYRILEQEMVDFARRYDPQPFHTDPDAAAGSLFGGLVAPGCQTIALAWKLAHDTGLFDGTMLGGIGLDQVRWVKPVRPGDSVHVEFFLTESRPSASKPDRQVVRFQYEMKNQRGEIVLTLQMIQVMRRRGSAAAEQG